MSVYAGRVRREGGDFAERRERQEDYEADKSVRYQIRGGLLESVRGPGFERGAYS
jgi:hypothetical protein